MKALCATDLSAASEAAIENDTCLHCLKRIGVETIHLVTVIPSNVHMGMPGTDLEGRRNRALARYSEVIEAVGMDVETHVVRGTPHRRINGIAEAEDVDLTIVNSRGRSPLENRVIGSTARNLSRTTVVPLLVNRVERATDEPEVVYQHLFRRVMYATDFSENAAAAFEMFDHLKDATQDATLVHVRTPKDPEPDTEDEAVERLEQLKMQLEEMGVPAETDVRRGDPAEEILAAEEEHDPTMVLMGSRGHSRLRRLLLGSVSEDVVARANGNVMLVPPPRKA